MCLAKIQTVRSKTCGVMLPQQRNVPSVAGPIVRADCVYQDSEADTIVDCVQESSLDLFKHLSHDLFLSCVQFDIL